MNDTALRALSATVSAIVAKTMVAPLERVKLLLQVQDAIEKEITRPYKGIIDALIRIPREQGFWSLWRGNLITIYRYAPQQMLNFSFYNFYNQQLTANNVIKSFAIQKFTAGALTGSTVAAIIYPLTNCQTQVSTDMGSKLAGHQKERRFTSLSQCLVKLYKLNGVFSIYKGAVPSIIGITMYRANYFALFDIGKQCYRIYNNSDDDMSRIPVFILYPIAQISALIASIIAYPMDTIARHLIMQSSLPVSQQEYKNARGAIVTLYRKGGLPLFFRGLLSNMLRGTGGALVLVFNDVILDMFIKQTK